VDWGGKPSLENLGKFLGKLEALYLAPGFCNLKPFPESQFWKIEIILFLLKDPMRFQLPKYHPTFPTTIIPGDRNWYPPLIEKVLKVKKCPY